MLDLNKKTVLITGGTGLLGHSFTRSLLQRFPGVEKVLIFSRDEQKQYEMAQIFSETPYQCLQFILGDIKDLKGLELALKGVDYVIHAAALKQVPASEYHPSQFIQTNISGTENLIYAALQHKVKAVIGISTDKAVEPASTYGATKLCMEKLLVQANFLQYNDKATPTAFSVVRLGNLLGARGSVVPAFLQSRSKGVISLMHADSSRFHITPQEAADFVLETLGNAKGGEIFVPKMPSFKITALAKAIAADYRQEVIGLRPGEKVHETMISGTEARYTMDYGDYYAIHSPVLNRVFIPKDNAVEVPADFSYCSASNTEWLSTENLKEIIQGMETLNRPV
jgi:UDP-N-acetylglucosamine 4,6-dehydratase/5-epimerase